MRICFIADARSTIARNWIEYFIARRHDVHVISSCRCAPDSLRGATLHQVPFAFGGFTGKAGGSDTGEVSTLGRFLQWIGNVSQGKLRTWLAPFDLFPKIAGIRRLLESIEPELVHAMRIPFEGILASMTGSGYPLLISCWGNDFELWARSLPGRMLTAQAVRRSQAFHCDSRKDLRLIYQWGFPRSRPTLVAPGAGGVQTDMFHPAGKSEDAEVEAIPAAARVVINPRGARIYIRNDVFFRAIPLVVREIPAAFFLCPALANDKASREVVLRLGLGERVRLLPPVTRTRMAALFRSAEVSVSPSSHDGTPNTLLEAMASGCLPVAGDIESVREWISDGVNGLLCDCTEPAALARAIVRGLRDSGLRMRAREHNLELIKQRAEYTTVMRRAEEFYTEIVDSCAGGIEGARSR